MSCKCTGILFFFYISGLYQVKCSPVPVLTATVVFNVSGDYSHSTITAVTGRYGATSPKYNISGPVFLADVEDNNYVGCSNTYGRVPIKQTWIALVERGICSFSDKISLATIVNASAILVYNHKYDDNFQMLRPDANEIVSISLPRSVGVYAKNKIMEGYSVTVDIRTGDYLPIDGMHPRTHRTSIIFVSLSFLILLIISMTWLVVYYVQRFRILETPDLHKHRKLVKKIVQGLPKKLLTTGDREIVSNEICPICIESYSVEETIRILPCEHVFHRKCVDTWLFQRETCPMCKFNIMKQKDISSSTQETPIILSVPAVEVWEPDQNPSTSNESLVHEEHRPEPITAVNMEPVTEQSEETAESPFVLSRQSDGSIAEDEHLCKSDVTRA